MPLRWVIAVLAVTSAAFGQSEDGRRKNRFGGRGGAALEADETVRAAREERDREDELLRLRGAELLREIPDLELGATPPVLRLTPIPLGVNLPFQFIDFGLVADLYASLLHVRGTYTFGVAIMPTGVSGTHYADVFAGLRLFSVHGERAEDIQLRTPMGFRIVKAWIPRSHGLYLEVGGITGRISFFRCTAGCDGIDAGTATFEAAPRQVILPAVGLRYLQYFYYRADHGGARESSAAEFFGQVVFKDVDAQKYTLYDVNDEPRGVADVGFRVGARTPPGFFYRCLVARKYCAASTLSIGYAPTAFPIFFEGSIEIPIDLW